MDLALPRPYRDTCARLRAARALFYHLSRRSRAHDRCSVGERGWEGGGGCTLSQEARCTRREREARGDRERRMAKRRKRRKEKAVSSVSVDSPIDSPPPSPLACIPSPCTPVSTAEPYHCSRTGHLFAPSYLPPRDGEIRGIRVANGDGIEAVYCNLIN